MVFFIYMKINKKFEKKERKKTEYLNLTVYWYTKLITSIVN